MIAALLRSALLDPYRPILAHLVVTRRCNLACAYCVEFDKVSAPVPREILERRMDHLARLRTVICTLTGGETLLHPEVPQLVRAIRARKMVPAINTNGSLLTEATIDALNAAGLYALQLSVDALEANDVTSKALRPLRPKLALLAKKARFKVRVNTVLGAAPAEEALEVVRAITAYGFEAKCSLMRNPDGTLAPMEEGTRASYREIARLEGRALGPISEAFQDALIDHGEARWKCRAGARFFHVCEDGRVHLCAPRWGAPGTPLESYTEADLRRAFHAKKACAAKCPVAYAHNVSQLDALRPQRGAKEAAHV